MTNQVEKTTPKKADKNNRAVALVCMSLVAGMVGMAYAAVPLYQLFCQVTGYGGTTQRAETGATEVRDELVTVRFDANASSGVLGEFRPAQKSVETRLGETTEVAYLYTNTSDKPVVSMSTFNVTPLQAGQFFNKIDCFCFTEQRVEPGETVRMPVVFFVDPEIRDDPESASVKTITLSYTFFPVDEPEEVSSLEDDNKDDAS